MAQDTVQKVKAHTSKVATIAQSKKEKEAQSLMNKKQEFEDRLKSAATRKETMTKKKIETAQTFQKLRNPSASPVKEE